METVKKTVQVLIIALIRKLIYHYVVAKSDSEQRHRANPSQISVQRN